MMIRQVVMAMRFFSILSLLGLMMAAMAVPMDLPYTFEEAGVGTPTSRKVSFGGITADVPGSTTWERGSRGSSEAAKGEAIFWKTTEGSTQIYSGIIAIEASDREANLSQATASLREQCPDIISSVIESSGDDAEDLEPLQWDAAQVAGTQRAQEGRSGQGCLQTRAIVAETDGRIYVVVSSIAMKRGVSFAELVRAMAIQSSLVGSVSIQAATR